MANPIGWSRMKTEWLSYILTESFTRNNWMNTYIHGWMKLVHPAAGGVFSEPDGWERERVAVKLEPRDHVYSSAGSPHGACLNCRKVDPNTFTDTFRNNSDIREDISDFEAPSLRRWWRSGLVSIGYSSMSFEKQEIIPPIAWTRAQLAEFSPK